MGGEHTVPAPDPIARDYLLLALRMDQRAPGLVDGYFGPAALKAQVDMEQLRSPARLVDDARDLLWRIPDEAGAPDRVRWLTAQGRALEVQAMALAGTPLPYLEHVERCFDFRPSPRPDEGFHDLAARLDALLPGSGPVGDRLATLDATLTVPSARVEAVAAWLVDAFRDRARRDFGLPDGESLRVELVRNQPWSGYNWYDGGLRSRVQLNLDLPIRAPELVQVLSHETFPGHHLEHAWKEADLVLGRGRLESAVLLINTPECLISEGLADLGHDFAVGPNGDADLIAQVAERAGLTAAHGTAGEREAWAARVAEIAALRRDLGAIAVNAALRRHVDGASHEAVARYLVDVGLMAPDRAEKLLEFIEHPLWRTYVFVYSEGEALLRRWLQAAPAKARAARFARLLHEQITPGQVAAEAS
jgi:hypothetical protein